MYKIILLLILAVLALSTTEVLPGSVIEATAAGTGYTLKAPVGFEVGAPTYEAGLTHWRIKVGAIPSRTPYRVELWQGGVLVDSRGVRVCCRPAAKPQVFLPWLQAPTPRPLE